jgi:hypothetical protein
VYQWCEKWSVLYKHLSRWQPYNISVPLDLKVTCDTMLILNIYTRALDIRLSDWCCGVSMVWVQIPSREEQQFEEIKYIIQTSGSKWQPYNISVPLDIKITKDTRVMLNIIYVWKLNQKVLELEFRTVKYFLFDFGTVPTM